MGRVRVPAADLAGPSASRATARTSPGSDLARRALRACAPALVLGWLGLTQAIAVVRHWGVFSSNPSWTVASELARSALYAAFVAGAAITLLSNKAPQSRDGRRVAAAASLSATFLLVGLSYLPAGPVLWHASSSVEQVGLGLSVLGAALALTAFFSLGSSFSITPEARALVVTGPYRFLRHPIYFAEMLMIVGVVVGYPRLTTSVGALCVVGLQIYRIQMEERLLRDAFHASFVDFSARTRFRLVPLLW